MVPPVLHPLLHHGALGLSLAALALHPTVPAAAGGDPDPAADCHAVMAFLQVAAFGAAVVFKARQEARLWAQHEAQRAAAGLRPERGWHARVYGGAAALAGATVAPLLVFALVMTGWQALMALGSACSGCGAAPA